VFVAPSRVFVGGHYPSDILAGLLVGLFASWLSQQITRNRRLFEALSVSSSPILFAMFFLWLFELGAGFTDVRQVANALWHIRQHL
jgi:membrane-associated phospholipid phosphatase